MSLPARPRMVPPGLRAAHGDYWAAAATDTALTLAGQWQLVLGEPHPATTRALVVDAVRRDGTHVVLKVPATPAAGRQAAAALRWFSGAGTTALLEVDDDTGTLLMPHLPALDIPATPAQVRTLVHTQRGGADLPVDVPGLAEHLEPLVAWARVRHDVDPALDGSSGDVDAACGVVGDLLDTTPRAGLLHGDLTGQNLRRSSEQVEAVASSLVAVSPRPCWGDPSFDLATWAVTLPHHPLSLRATCRAVAGADPLTQRRVLAWAWCLCVLTPASSTSPTWQYQRPFVRAHRNLSRPASA